ncbi:MAG: NifB/NifX family molybdenum-iron cluster-binding protein [Bacteroidales bacterium]|nr:NifB/NifX family molybdenum-iron cluster-binding protein [Bacteroidales bacterium]
MKTVITSTGDTIKATFDKRFGRAEWFCVYDETDGSTIFHHNKYADSPGGAGTKAAEMPL